MQQINLYQPIFRHQRKLFSAKTMLQAAGFVLAGLVLVYGYARWQTVSLETQLDKLATQHRQASERLTEVTRRFPPPAKDPYLERQLEARRAEMAAKRRLVTVLDRPDWVQVDGFAERLEALARQRPERLWLQRVVLEGRHDVSLIGSTLAPEQLPQFIQRLGEEPSMQGIEFRQFLMERTPDRPEQVDFTLHTRAAEERP